MKDKQIKYLLTLKRQFESIRHDQYIFSEKNPVDDSVQSDNPLLKLYQLINFSLQSIEFKILETVNISSKKPKNEINNTLIKQDKDDDYTYSENQMKIQINPQQIKNLSLTKTMSDKSSQFCIDMETPGKLSLNKFSKSQDLNEQFNYSVDRNKEAAKHDGKQKKKFVAPFQNKLSDQTHQNDQSVKQDIIMKDQLKFEIDSLQKSDNKQQQIFKIEKNIDLRQNSISYQNPITSIIQNDIRQISLSSQKSSVQQTNPQNVNSRQNFIDERNNQNLFGEIPYFLPSLKQKNQSSVEIKQLFTDEREEQLKIYDSKIKQTQDQNNQNDLKMITYDGNYVLKQDEKIQFEDNNDQNGIDQYLNFETPKKITNDYFEESEIQERYIIPNNFSKFIGESSIKKTIEQQVDNINESNQFGVDDQLTQTKNLIRIRKYANVKQLPNNNELKTVKKIPCTKNIIENSDQPVKYRFCEVTTEKKRQLQDSQEHSTDKIETETKLKKSILSNKKINHSNQCEIITNTSNKKISKKLEYKQDEDFRSYVRGPYNFYSEELKKKAIKDYHKYKDIKKAAEINEVKVKNLKRWITVGHKRKEGGGRKKEDPDMEEKVYQWLCDQHYNQKQNITRNQIREQALWFSNKKEKFKASKGWLEKFFVRYNCKFMSQQDKQNPENEEEENEEEEEDEDYLIESNENIQ